MKRHSIGSRHSKSMFSKHADRTHRRNIAGSRPVMRGGIRL